jgi:excisionase family DNA binding protein
MTTSDTSAKAQRPHDLVDVAGAAAYLNTSARHVRRLVSERRLPHFKLGAKVRLSAADLDDFLASSRVEAPNRPGGQSWTR